MAVGRSIIGGGGGGSYSYIRFQMPEKQLISKEIDCAKPEYVNMSPPNYQSSYGPVVANCLWILETV